MWSHNLIILGVITNVNWLNWLCTCFVIGCVWVQTLWRTKFVFFFAKFPLAWRWKGLENLVAKKAVVSGEQLVLFWVESPGGDEFLPGGATLFAFGLVVSLLIWVSVMNCWVLIDFIYLCDDFMALNWLRDAGDHIKISHMGRLGWNQWVIVNLGLFGVIRK